MEAQARQASAASVGAQATWCSPHLVRGHQYGATEGEALFEQLRGVDDSKCKGGLEFGQELAEARQGDHTAVHTWEQNPVDLPNACVDDLSTTPASGNIVNCR